jgi:hypothetical protein
MLYHTQTHLDFGSSEGERGAPRNVTSLKLRHVPHALRQTWDVPEWIFLNGKLVDCDCICGYLNHYKRCQWCLKPLSPYVSNKYISINLAHGGTPHRVDLLPTSHRDTIYGSENFCKIQSSW